MLLLSSAAELSPLCTTEDKKVSSLNNLVLDDNSSAKSFMHIKKIMDQVSLWDSCANISPRCLRLLSVFCSLKNHIISLKGATLQIYEEIYCQGSNDILKELHLVYD